MIAKPRGEAGFREVWHSKRLNKVNKNLGTAFVHLFSVFSLLHFSNCELHYKTVFPPIFVSGFQNYLFSLQILNEDLSFTLWLILVHMVHPWTNYYGKEDGHTVLDQLGLTLEVVNGNDPRQILWLLT